MDAIGSDIENVIYRQVHELNMAEVNKEFMAVVGEMDRFLLNILGIHELFDGYDGNYNIGMIGYFHVWPWTDMLKLFFPTRRYRYTEKRLYNRLRREENLLVDNYMAERSKWRRTG